MTRTYDPSNETMGRIDTEVAWCAGFFDGEGHVSYHRGYPSSSTSRVSPQIYANIPQCSDNIEVLEFFQSVIGFGQIKGPFSMPNSKRTQHKVHYGKNEIEPLFLILRPYLRKEKTFDFQRALMAYMMHDPKPNEEDWARLRRKNEKKASKESK
jgi:hypothetical protein